VLARVDDGALSVDEHDVDCEAHEEHVDAGTGLEPEALARLELAAAEEAPEARSEADRDSHSCPQECAGAAIDDPYELAILFGIARIHVYGIRYAPAWSPTVQVSEIERLLDWHAFCGAISNPIAAARERQVTKEVKYHEVS
jgi:hypothetical protein